MTTLDPLQQNATYAASQLAQWKKNHTGDFALGASNQFGWLRLPQNASIFKTVQDPSAGPTSAHFEFIFTVSIIDSNISASICFSLPLSDMPSPVPNRITFWPSLRLSQPAATSLPCSLILYLRLLVSSIILECYYIVN